MFQDGMNKQGKRKRKTVTIKAKIRAINRNVDYDIIDRTVRPIKQYGKKKHVLVTMYGINCKENQVSKVIITCKKSKKKYIICGRKKIQY